MKARHCALSDGGSWTDPVTNAIAVDGFGPTELARVLQGQALPPDSIASFLHELTHHWCFRTSVGTALAELHASYERLAITAPNPVPDALFEIRSRFLLAVETLRPISEGLALFAEFDVMPSTSPGQTADVLRTAIHLYGTLDRPGRPDLAELLLTARLERNLVRRKLDLLMQSLQWSGAGYLPGYLLIHDVYRGLGQRSASDLEPDLFLLFFVTYIYESEALRSLLADIETPFLEWARDWQTAWRTLLFEALESVDTRTAKSIALEAISRRSENDVVGMRDVVSLAELAVTLERHELSVCVKHNDVVLLPKTSWPQSARTGDATLELWMLPELAQMWAIVFQTNQVVVSQRVAGRGDNDLNALLSTSLSREMRLRRREAAAEEMSALIKSDPRTQGYAVEFQKALEGILEILADFLFTSLPEEVGDSLGERMYNGQFLSVFDDDLQAAEDYVRLSLASRALLSSATALGKLPSNHQQVFHRAVARAKQIESKTGIPLVIQDDDQLYCLL